MGSYNYYLKRKELKSKQKRSSFLVLLKEIITVTALAIPVGVFFVIATLYFVQKRSIEKSEFVINEILISKPLEDIGLNEELVKFHVGDYIATVNRSINQFDSLNRKTRYTSDWKSIPRIEANVQGIDVWIFFSKLFPVKPNNEMSYNFRMSDSVIICQTTIRTNDTVIRWNFGESFTNKSKGQAFYELCQRITQWQLWRINPRGIICHLSNQQNEHQKKQAMDLIYSYLRNDYGSQQQKADDSWIHLELGRLLNQFHYYKEAEQQFKLATLYASNKSEKVNALIEWSIYYLNSGGYREAIKKLDEADAYKTNQDRVKFSKYIINIIVNYNSPQSVPRLKDKVLQAAVNVIEVSRLLSTSFDIVRARNLIAQLPIDYQLELLWRMNPQNESGSVSTFLFSRQVFDLTNKEVFLSKYDLNHPFGNAIPRMWGLDEKLMILYYPDGMMAFLSNILRLESDFSLLPEMKKAYPNLKYLTFLEDVVNANADHFQKWCNEIPFDFVYYSQARKYLDENNEVSAVHYFEKCIKSSSVPEFYQRVWGERLKEKERFVEADSMYRKAIKNNRTGFDLTTPYSDFLVYWAAKVNSTEAIYLYRKALSYNPRNIEALVNLAIAYTDASQNEQAEKMYNIAVELDSFNNYSLSNGNGAWLIYSNYSTFFVRTGKQDKALLVLQQAKKHPLLKGSTLMLNQRISAIYNSMGEGFNSFISAGWKNSGQTRIIDSTTYYFLRHGSEGKWVPKKYPLIGWQQVTKEPLDVKGKKYHLYRRSKETKLVPLDSNDPFYYSNTDTFNITIPENRNE